MPSIVLLSGGLDSAVSLGQALREGEVKLCLTFDYGQRARLKEVKSAIEISGYYRLKHRVITLPFLRDITGTSLVNTGVFIPEPKVYELDQDEMMSANARLVWVPNRNGLFINIAAAFAESMGCTKIVAGLNAEEAKSFPDNSREFLAAANQALSFSTLNRVRVISYTQMLNKTEIVKLGRTLGTPFQYIWPCYYGGEIICGLCESCLRYLRALKTMPAAVNE